MKKFFNRCSNTNKFPPYSVKKKNQEAISRSHRKTTRANNRNGPEEAGGGIFIFFLFFFREGEMIGWPIEMQIGPRLFRCTRSPVTTAQIRSFPSPMGFSVSQTTRCRSREKKEGKGGGKKISKPIAR